MQMKNPRVTCSSCIRVIWLRCAKTAASPVCLYFIIIVIMVIMIVCRLGGRGLGSAAGWMERERSQSPRVASPHSLCVIDNAHAHAQNMLALHAIFMAWWIFPILHAFVFLASDNWQNKWQLLIMSLWFDILLSPGKFNRDWKAPILVVGRCVEGSRTPMPHEKNKINMLYKILK